MFIHLKGVRDADELREARVTLARETWGDGRVTAGAQSAQAKNDPQLPRGAEATRALQRIVLGGLNLHATFFSAALPKRVFPPLFNPYAGSVNAFGNHVDDAVRFTLASQAERACTDLSKPVVQRPFPTPSTETPLA